MKHVVSLDKRAYVAPEITLLGSFEEVTQGGTDGDRLDATFPAGTPIGALTFHYLVFS